MKKKIILGLLILLSIVFITGCGKNNENEPQENIPNETKNTNNNESNKIELYSDDTKFVLKDQNIIHVFYYEGDEITGHTTYIDYNDHSSAQAAYSIYNMAELELNDSQADRIYVEGQYLVTEFNESEYENLTVADMKRIYSYMTEIKK